MTTMQTTIQTIKQQREGVHGTNSFNESKDFDSFTFLGEIGVRGVVGIRITEHSVW